MRRFATGILIVMAPDSLYELLHRGTGSIHLLGHLLFRVLERDVGRPRGLALWRRASVGTRTS